MKMLSWSNGQSAAGEIPAPNWLSWEPELSAVAAGFDNAVVIYRIQPQFTAIASLSIQVLDTTSLLFSLLFHIGYPISGHITSSSIVQTAMRF